MPRELLTAGIPLDAELEIERQLRMETLKATLTRMHAAGQSAEAIDQVIGVVVQLERENERLAWRVIRANRYRFGRSTEKLSRAELQQLLFALEGKTEANTSADGNAELRGEPSVPVPAEPEQVESPAESEPAPTTPDSQDSTAKDPDKKRHRVRSMKVDPNVKRNIKLVPVPENERICALCGREKKVYGYVDHECIRYVPAHLEVDVERREKAGCEHCRKDVSVAPRQQVPAIRRKVDASLLAKLIGQKCTLALPLDRQRRELSRLGLDAPEKTLQSYWAYGTDLLEPIAIATQSLVFGKAIVGVDDTHLKTLDKSSKHGAFRGHIWCFDGTDGLVNGPETIAYGYTQTWNADEITDWFSAIEGQIQCDGYAGYSREVEDDDGETLVAVPPERRLGCGMHIRSKFHAAMLAQDRRAAIPIKFFGDLYHIESDCKTRGLDADARGEERRRRSLPILDAFDAWVDGIHPKLLPKSPLRRATTYAINQRPFFRRCFEDGRYEIDNGRVERRIRLFAVARRGFLFTGSPRGGQRLAVAFTLTDNCLVLGLEPYLYFVDVIDKLERGWPLRQLSELIPQNWAAARQT